MHLLEFQSGLLLVVYLLLLVAKGFAFIDAISRRPDAFVAADKQTKAAWLWMTGLSLVAAVLIPFPFGIISIIGTVASFVYLLDVRPALVSVTRR